MGSTGDEKPIVIVGAGLTGSCAGILFAQRFPNEQFVIIESRDDYRKELTKLKGNSLKQESNYKMNSNPNEEKTASAFGQYNNAASRSINLTLTYRGICCLKKAGIWDEVQKRELLMPIKGRYIHNSNNTTSIQAYEHAIHSVSRLRLNCMLLDMVDNIPNIDVRFMNKLIKINKNGILTISCNSNKMYQLKSKFILGCDGAYSATRSSLQRLGRYNCAIEYMEHGYKELTITPVFKTTNNANKQCNNSDPMPCQRTETRKQLRHNNNNNNNNSNNNNSDNEEFALDPNYLHLWPRDEFLIVGLPNPDKTFTCTLFAPWDGEKGLNYLEKADKQEIISYFNENFADFVQLCPNFYHYWKKNPASPLGHIHLKPWNYGGKILLLGDAAHAIVPFYGQGMNSGFEDSLILDELFDKHMSSITNDLNLINIETVFNQFSHIRQPSVEALSLLSLQNYIELRSLTCKKWFLYKKKFEDILYYIAPNIWRPVHSLVTFTRMPYDKALERAQKQDKYLAAGLALVIGVSAVGGYMVSQRYCQASVVKELDQDAMIRSCLGIE